MKVAVWHVGLCLVLFVMWSGLARAEIKNLDGPAIESVLSGNTVKGTRPNGTPWMQYFDKTGRTQYREAGAMIQTGLWEVRGNKFCSKWPPSDLWSCYQIQGDLVQAPVILKWLFSDGDEWDGHLVKGYQL